MKKSICFTGVGTALVTPFRDGEIDFPCLLRLIEEQISGGIDALIVGGTTAEVATLSDGERERLYAFCAEKVGGRVKFILGTGSLDTKKAIYYTKLAASLKADGALSVTPYYNKGTVEGIYRHFLSVAEACEMPTIIYNVPTRTAVNIGIETLARLAEHENIAGLKESNDSLSRLSELAVLAEELPLYSGNDYANLAFYAHGARGAVSVVSNLYPKQTKRIWELYKDGNIETARTRQNDMTELVHALFLETNPSVVKFALERFGICTEEVRLPLTPPTSATRERLVKAINGYEKTLTQ